MTEHPDADVIVVGSGFGGAVAAARLAQAGLAVVVLERGRRWGLGDFPRAPRLDDGWLWQHDHGLFDVRWLDRMITVQGAGWGGGSLVYANVFARPSDRALDPTWPEHLRRGSLEPYYDLAAHMLGVAPSGDDPRTGQLPPRTALIEELMASSDRSRASFRPNLAITFGDPDTWVSNRHGVPRRGCAFVGECILGCNHGAKNTLDTNYLALAERSGARAVTDAQVDRIEPHPTGYAVTTSTPSDLGAARRTWTAPRVVLAAGAVATTELLLRSRDVHRTLPRLSRQLGAGFSGNGDFLTMAELRGSDSDMTTGPTITTSTIVDVPEGRGTVWFQVQDGAFPLALHELFDVVIPGRHARQWWRSRTVPPALHRVFAALAMGRDSGNGTLRLDRSGEASLTWRNAWQSRLYRAQRRLGPMLSRLLGVRTYLPVTWSLMRRTTTVHPLGGVRSGPDAATAVVDEDGEVHGYPGLFVMDGSVLPASTGANPSATILAVAERSVEALVRRSGNHGWRAPEWDDVVPGRVPEDAAYEFAARLHASTAGGGVRFRERMVSTSSAPRRVVLRLEAELPSVTAFRASSEHLLAIDGTLDVAGVVRGAAVTGSLSLFPPTGEAMRYDALVTHDERTWRLTGTKTVRRRTPWSLVRGLTRLDVALEPEAPGASLAAVVVIGPRDLVRLLASLRGVGFTRARRVRSAAQLVTFFARAALRHPGRS